MYFIVAPLTSETSDSQFVFFDYDCGSVVGRAMTSVRKSGATLRTAKWLAGGNATVILFDLESSAWALEPCRAELVDSSDICIPEEDAEMRRAAIFGYVVAELIGHCRREAAGGGGWTRRVVAHFHGWSASLALILLRKRGVNAGTVYTTHGSQMARDLCANYADFHNDVTSCDFDDAARKLGLGHRHHAEKVAASMAHVLTAVSDVSAIETQYLLQRRPDYVTCNGLDLASYLPAEQLDRFHAAGKAKIHQLIRQHLDVNFDLTRTQYYFFASRFQSCNEGADIFVESLARLNHALKDTGSKETVVAFFILPSENVKSTGNAHCPLHSGPRSLSSILILITDPDPDLRSWSFSWMPILHVTGADDEAAILDDLKRCNLLNHDEDRVRIIVRPNLNFSTGDGRWLHWQEFLVGCHLSVLPSYYEPWGHTAAECIVHGVPTVTTNCSGFGRFMEETHQGDHLHENGVFIVDRRYKSVEESVCQLAQWMLHLNQLDHNQRSRLRSRVRRLATLLDWNVLYDRYLQARQTAIDRNELANGFDAL